MSDEEAKNSKTIKVQKGSPAYELLKERLAEKRRRAVKQPSYYNVPYDDYADLLNILDHLL